MTSSRDNILAVRQEITDRFFDAVYKIISEGKVKNISTFSELLGQERKNFYSIEHYSSRATQLYMCAYLVKNFNVNGDWLLTGKGNIFEDRKIEDTEKANIELSKRQVTLNTLNALDYLKSIDQIKSPLLYIHSLGFSRSTHSTIKADKGRYISLYVLKDLVGKFNISGTWLFTRIGNIRE